MKYKKMLSLAISATMAFSPCFVYADVKTEPLNENASYAQLNAYEQDTEKLSFNDKVWNYDETNDVYWQIQVAYCSRPETEE